MTDPNGKPELSGKKAQSQGTVAEWSLQAKDTKDHVFAVSGEHLVGREDCELLLTSPHSSRKHAKLTLSEGLLRVEDLGSANGTYVNDEKIVTAELKDGDVVRFDTEEFFVIEPTQPVAEPVDENRTMMRPAIPAPEAVPEQVVPQKAPEKDPEKDPEKEPEKAPAPPPKAEPKKEEAPVSEAAPEDTAGDEGATKEIKGGAWYEKETLQMTAKVNVSDLREQFADCATQIVRGITSIDMPSLVGTTGDWAGKVFNLTSDAMTLGRRGADIIIDEASVSTKHAQFVKQGDRWKVVDLMSTSGTYVNGKKTQASFLSSGDALRLGRVELRFVIDSTDVASRASPDATRQVITGTGQKFSSKVPAWLYIALGFVAVLAIGAILIFSG
ncbi:FHA domain-containing protein [Gammaproteobacteria bacterium]|nr:FHA domain-containing protein [Gammaproteobacteria bacterium]